MKNRKPFELRTFMAIYNMVLVIVSAYMVYEVSDTYKYAYSQWYKVCVACIAVYVLLLPMYYRISIISRTFLHECSHAEKRGTTSNRDATCY